MDFQCVWQKPPVERINVSCLHSSKRNGRWGSINGNNNNNNNTRDQPRALVVRVSDHWSWGPGFDSLFYNGDFSLKEDSHGDHGLGSLVELRFKVPPGTSYSHILPSTSSGQRNCASWASQPQKSVTLRLQPGGETTKSIRDMWWHYPSPPKKNNINTLESLVVVSCKTWVILQCV
jgi:hypothetical protein